MEKTIAKLRKDPKNNVSSDEDDEDVHFNKKGVFNAKETGASLNMIMEVNETD